MNIGGFARTLQADFTTLLVTLVVIGVATGLALYLAGFAGADDTTQYRKVIVRSAYVCGALSVITFLAHAMILGFTDRMPRSDVDKQPVYDQMNSH